MQVKKVIQNLHNFQKGSICLTHTRSLLAHYELLKIHRVENKKVVGSKGKTEKSGKKGNRTDKEVVSGGAVATKQEESKKNKTTKNVKVKKSEENSKE